MKEEYICMATPQARTYYKVQCVAKEFLDKDNNVVNTTGEIPEGQVTEFSATTATTKHFSNGKLHGRLEVRNLTDHSITFSEEYNYGQLVNVTDHTSPNLLKVMEQEAAKATPIYPGTVLKTGKDVRAFYVDGKQIAEETLSANGATLELLGSIPNGPVKEFFESGKLKTEATYQNNKLHGEMICYDETGNILSKETYEQGVLKGPAEYFSYARRGPLHTACNYKNALLDGPFTLRQVNDNTVREQATYAKGRLHGPRTTYYANGTLEAQETWTDGKLQGARKLYFPGGTLWYEENYVNGRLEGDRTEYFASGKTRQTEMYSDGMLNGQRNTYDETGNLIASEEYHWGNIVHNTEYRPL